MMSKMILLVAGVLGLAGLGSAQLTQPGQCETITYMNNFVLNSFIGANGIWHEVGKLQNQPNDCSRLEFDTGGTTNTVPLNNPSVVNNFAQTATGTAVHATGTSRLTLTLTSSTTPIDFWVLNTDYTNYAIAINCVNQGATQRIVNVWQLGRAANSFETSATLAAANTVLATIGLSVSDLTSVDHSTDACTILPVVGAGQPVILPGQCNTATPVVQGFQVAEFIGTWYEISSYYSQNAVGTCAKADYTLAGTTVNIVNSQVLSGRLDTITGTATVVGTNAEGRLSVVLNVNGFPVNQELLILDTNYNGYAVSYTCVNLPNNQRQVNSWILSRTQTITAASQTEVDRVINSFVDLNNEYFQLTDQSATGCFYYPEFTPGTPVVFPGQCDENIPVHINFDPSLYTGLWYDIESYPSTFQQGTCNNALYTLTSQGTVDVFNTQVVNQRLDTMRGEAIIPDPNQPAKLVVSFPVAGTDQTTSTNYWVLATDYETYSLVYTCQNLADDRRAVFSWKLGRAKAAFSAAANTAMNVVIDNINVLDSQYFADRDQTAAGCFYHPELTPGTPVVFPGQCDESIPVQTNFDPSLYTGLWYDIESYPSTFQQGTCNNALYTLTPQGTVDVFNTQVVNQRLDTMSGEAIIPDPTQPAKLVVSFPVAGTDQTTSTNYWVLATDYETYSLVYTCQNLADDRRAVFSWKLGRAKAAFSAAANTAMNVVIDNINVLDSQYFADRDQTAANCFYYPELTPGTPVVFPGQCDESIPVHTNFDPSLYTGLWYDIESYPSTFQQGTCNNALYTLTPQGTVDVFNTQVVNQRLDTIRGEAIIPDPTQPAKLLVSFPVAGTDQTTSTNYWVLATDYDTYSLVYTCQNLPDDRRAVFSWKLGRTKAAFSTTANAAMNAVINNINVLDSQYFSNRDQTAAGCFYFPEPEAGRPVIFPGQCDNSVAAVPNFDLSQFIGRWHEVQTYPKEQQSGTCVNHVFSTGTTANTLNLESNQVISQTLSSASGNVAFESTTDSSGRLTLTMTVNGGLISFPYWVLATDYSSYALVYSCLDGLDDTRAVYSWKLSRDQTLTDAANANINNAIQAVQVLDNRYYESVDQSALACFYYPVFQPGVPVEFPGQCDQSIPVQANFEPTNYAGLWYDIESYPSTFQQGTCNNALYTLTPQGTVDVFNTQVVNQRLDTMRGEAIPDPTQPAKLVVSFPVAGTDQTTSTNYWVLATDYSSYSLVYTCENLPNNRRAVFSWKLGRSKAAFSAAANAAMNAVINNVNVLDGQYFANRDQTAAGCFYFPEHVEGRPVVFPGQCDNSVAAVPNFNMAEFVGTWHEIQTYPKEQQTGTCVNHAFTTGATTSSLNLVSNQVIDQIANSASGIVAFESTDGTGKLRLTMTINGADIEFPYWVLATDYNNYALVYSCMNNQHDTRSVYSWKLSRTQTLSDAADTAINNAIQAVQVLDNQYYDPVDQSATGCVSYPDIPAGDPIVIPGQCGTVTPVTAFNSADFAGTWYEAARYASERQSGECAASQFDSSGQNEFTLSQTIIYNDRLTVVSGPVTFPTDGSGVLTATLTDGSDVTYTTTVYVLDTDYRNFALLYSCENVPGSNLRQLYSWKFSRTQTGLSAEANDRIDEVIANTEGLLEYYFQPVGQTSNDCFYYPVFPVPPESITLPGACPPITAIPAFDPTAYLGHWYDIESYPIASQNGTCSRALYSLDGGAIQIRNTMVVDGELKTQDGIARLSSGGTGLLTVTFVLENGEEVVSTYYILATDYTSFSLVYNCRNLSDGSRQVFSWKLSRTPELTAEANTVINNFISSTQGLLEEYYFESGQTDADCFYVPEPVPGQSVLFRGACVPPVLESGFNANQYLGWWHEMERYYSEDTPGECISTNFVQSGTSIQVVDSSVSGGNVNEITGTAVIQADGTLIITRNNVATTSYVLDTDYTSYSLVYSCQTVPTEQGDYRRVWSAKYSKSRSLSTADNAAIDATIADHPLLYPQFYETVNQADGACFAYRDDPGSQIILPGQCDTTIPVQAGFEVSRFAGTWYQIERYPYPQVGNDGTCVGTRYTQTNNGLNVLNWEVLEGALSTIEGTATVDEASATLNINIPQEGQEENIAVLRVLLTDYTNYALLYSCVNINQFQRSVGAFKVSRSRALSNDDQYAIETYMASRPELHEPYFISISHDDDCLEPSSALLVKSSIIVILVCALLQLVM